MRPSPLDSPAPPSGGAAVRGRAAFVALICVSAVLALAGPRVAHATPEQDKAEARHEFDAGTEADKRKDWAGALDHYLRANDLLEHPFTIYNIATDYERLGKLREAAVWYRRYLDKATDPNDLAKVRQQLADLEARPGPLTIRSVPGGARAFVDDAPVGVTPLTVPVKGGSHRVAVEHNGQRIERDIRLTYGEPQDVNIPLGAQPATLLVFGTPAGATIYVDGQPSGTLPSAQVPVNEGTHEVRVVSVGYTSYDGTTQATAGGITKVPVSLQRGSDGSSLTAGLAGTLIGYYFAIGGGVSIGTGGGTGSGGGEGTNGTDRIEFGLTAAGHYDVGLALAKIGDAGSTELVEIGGRYTLLPDARVSPYIGVGYIISPQGFSASVGLRIDLYHSATAEVGLLAQGGISIFTPSADLDAETPTTPGTATTFPVMLSIIGAYGKRIGALAATPPPPVPMSAQGPP